MSTDIKLSKVEISELLRSGGSLGSLLSNLAGALVKAAVLSAKKFLAPLQITSATLATEAAIKKKIIGSGKTTLIISNKGMNIMTTI